MAHGTIKIDVGDVCHVWEEKGVDRMKEGWGTSEKTGGPQPDVVTTEDLVCAGKRKGSKWPFTREDGTIVWVHQNHLCPCQAYNTLTRPSAQRVQCQFG